MTSRRSFTSAAWLLASGAPAWAQRPAPPGKIGYLHPRTIDPDHATLRLLRPAWQELGYAEGSSVLLRSGQNDAQRLPGLVQELIDQGVGVLIVVGAAAVRAASQVTRSTPIVAIDYETDPVRAGLAASLGRPGGNLTGLFLDQPSLAGKWIALLREAAPTLRRIALLWDPATGRGQLDVALGVAQAAGLATAVLELGPPEGFDAALKPFGQRPATGIVQLGTAGFGGIAARFAAAAARHRLPTIGFLKAYAEAGLLMSYGPDQGAHTGRAVVLADKILRGAKPGELPIERPARFEFVINLLTAKALGLTMPQNLLLRADEVIQ